VNRAAVRPAGDWIRGISIRQPWTAAILSGAKTIENRSRPWRGWILLHASLTLDRPALRTPLVARTVHGRALVTGAVHRVARLTDCHQDPDGSPPCTEWAQPGRWHLVLADVQALALPLTARGQLGAWRPTDDLLSRVLRQLPDLRP
jgi:hypothetical protein